MKILGIVLLGVLAVMGEGCTTVSSPVLRHETGETLGYHHYSVSGHLETAELFPLLPAGDPATTILQDASVYQAVSLGADASYGLFRSLDLQFGTRIAKGGGGWRLGAKYLLMGNPERESAGPGNFALSAQLGYGVSSGTGTVTYLVPGGTEDLDETLSYKTLDVAFPVSYRINTNFAPYSGLLFFRNSISGAVADSAVSNSSTDVGVNLGLKVTSGNLTGDAEVALLKLGDVGAGSKTTPFFGVSFGVVY